jgi:hypothetical protein
MRMTLRLSAVKMRVESEVTVRALDDGHGAGLAGRQAMVEMPSLVPGGHRVRENTHHLTEQFPVEGERKAQGKGHGD